MGDEQNHCIGLQVKSRAASADTEHLRCLPPLGIRSAQHTPAAMCCTHVAVSSSFSPTEGMVTASLLVEQKHRKAKKRAKATELVMARQLTLPHLQSILLASFEFTIIFLS